MFFCGSIFSLVVMGCCGMSLIGFCDGAAHARRSQAFANDPIGAKAAESGMGIFPFTNWMVGILDSIHVTFDETPEGQKALAQAVPKDEINVIPGGSDFRSKRSSQTVDELGGGIKKSMESTGESILAGSKDGFYRFLKFAGFMQ